MDTHIDYMDQMPEIEWVITFGRCETCDTLNMLRGDFRHVNTDHRSMGAERIYNSRCYASCRECETELWIEADFSEYPMGDLKFYDMRTVEVEYEFPDWVVPLIDDVESAVEVPEEYLIAPMSTIRRYEQSGYLDELEELGNLSKETVRNFRQAFDELWDEIDNLVLVLGSFRDRERGEAPTGELDNIKHKLAERGYDAYTADEIPEMEKKDFKQKIRLLMGLSKFCVMIDNEPSGHISEYELAKQERSILARIAPEGDESTSGSDNSTSMVGPEEWEIHHINEFVYEESPEEALDEAINWAEDYSSKRKEHT
jgi:hypothetical protein